MESALIDALLPVVRQVANGLAGGPAGDDALADVRTLEGIVGRHVADAEAEVLGWLAGRLHPVAVVQPSPAP